MKNQVTSIGQSKRLIELGVPADRASMVYRKTNIVGIVRLEVKKGKGGVVAPAFTVADLLGLIKSVVFTTNGLNPTLEKTGEDRWDFEFGQISEDEEYGFAHNKSLIDLLVGRIEWVVSNGYGLNL